MTEADRSRILVVDDEREILDFFGEVLAPGPREPSAERVEELEARLFRAAPEPAPAAGGESYRLLCCSQGDEAVRRVGEGLAVGRPFAVVFLDMRMPPGPDGLWTAREIRRLDPEVNIVIVTAFTDVDPAEISKQVRPADKLLYLQKPLNHYEITQLAAALSAKWRTERALNEMNRELEAQVAARTAELSETNIALKVLLKQRDRDREELDQRLVSADEKLLFNIKKVTLPSLAHLRESGLNKRQMELLAILSDNLSDVVSPVMQRVSTQGEKFTPSELNIANLIKQGKTTKEIAGILNLGRRTVEFHRANIRKKLKITNQKENLKTILLTMD